MSERSVTYPEMLNFFYQNQLHLCLSSQALCMAHALMWKWNSLLRPASFHMWNSELQSLSRINTQIGRVRQQLCRRCKIDGIPLFTYVSEGTRQAGIYKINDSLVTRFGQESDRNRTGIGQINDNLGGPSKEKIRKEKEKDTSSYLIDSYISDARARTREGKDFSKEQEKFTEVCRMFGKVARGFSPQTDRQREQMIQICQYAPTHIGWALDIARKNGIKKPGIIAYVLKCLANQARDGNIISRQTLRQRMDKLKAEITELNELEVNAENFPEGSPSGYQRTPEEVRADKISDLEARLKSLRERMDKMG